MIIFIIVPLSIVILYLVFTKVKLPATFKTKIGIPLFIIGLCVLIYSFIGNFQKEQISDTTGMDKQMGLPDRYSAHVMSKELYEDKDERKRVRIWGAVCLLIGIVVYVVSKSVPPNTPQQSMQKNNLQDN